MQDARQSTSSEGESFLRSIWLVVGACGAATAQLDQTMSWDEFVRAWPPQLDPTMVQNRHRC
jgi:hypothetical protein